jgi:hypothetical protein
MAGVVRATIGAATPSAAAWAGVVAPGGMAGDMAEAAWSGAPADARVVTPVAEDPAEAAQAEDILVVDILAAATEVVATAVVAATEAVGTEAAATEVTTRARRRPQARSQCEARRLRRRVFDSIERHAHTDAFRPAACEERPNHGSWDHDLYRNVKQSDEQAAGFITSACPTGGYTGR